MPKASDAKKIGHLIARVRQQRGLTQSEFAKLLSTSQSAVNRIEKGNQNVSIEMLGRISDVLNKQIIKIASNGSVSFQVEGKQELSGEITTKTSKNAAVAMLCGSLLNQGTTRLKSMPRIEEVHRIIEVLRSIGVSIKWHGSDLEIKPPAKLKLNEMDEEAAIRTRTVIMFLGPLMHVEDQFKIPFAGGCKLGKRTVAPHMYALEDLGLKIRTTDTHYEVTSEPVVPTKPIVMYESGDTATENILMAAARIPGKTTIKMASSNYMVQDVCLFLQKLGVKVEGIGTTTMTVYGKKDIKKNVTFCPSEDPVEAMTFVAAAATTNSEIVIKRTPLDFLELELLKLEKMGLKHEVVAEYKAENGYTRLADVRILKHNGNLHAPDDKVYARPFPGLNIDNLPYFVPIAAVAKGRTLIHDWVYENRAIYYTELTKLGASITLADPHRVYIDGPTNFKAADVVCPPALRPAVLILIAMMAAEGTSILRNVYSINRGYEDLANRLNEIGANITVLSDM